MQVIKFILLGLVFASANADCQPSNEREVCTVGVAWSAATGVYDSSPQYKCACADADGKYNAICSPGETCETDGTCAAPPCGDMGASCCSDGSCNGTYRCKDMYGNTWYSMTGAAPGPSYSCKP